MIMNKGVLAKICKKHKVKLLLLFGSHARGGVHSKSDIDLAFYAPNHVDKEELWNELLNYFKTEEIDLVDIWGCQNHLLRWEILHTGKVIYEEVKGMKNTFEWQTWIDYMDFQRYYAWQEQILSEQLAEL